MSVSVEQDLNLSYHSNIESMVRVCDVITINCPLHPETEHLFNDALIGKMKRGAYIVNTARGKICDRDAIGRALESGQLAGYVGDVWFPQPAPQDHPWRTMPHHGMTPHISGTSLAAQARYAAGVREILECWFSGRPIRDEYLIVHGGKLAGVGAHSYSAGNATGGSRKRYGSKNDRAQLHCGWPARGQTAHDAARIQLRTSTMSTPTSASARRIEQRPGRVGKEQPWQ
jgi:formate dehydrogenase